MTQALIKYEAACRAIAECKSFDEVKSWADKAAAMQAYQRMAGDKSLEIDAAEIRIRAERRLGEMILAAKADGGLNRGAAGMAGNQHTGKVVRSGETTAPKLSDVGISKDQSSRAQKLAAVPEGEFEAELAAKREREKQDNARVTARLEASGERHMKAAQPQAPASDDDSDDVVKLLEQLQSENIELQAQVAAISADDPRAEAAKWRKAYDHAVRQQSEAMDRAKDSTDREKWVMRQLMRCGKAVGQEDPTKIAAAVEGAMRAKAAA